MFKHIFNIFLRQTNNNYNIYYLLKNGLNMFDYSIKLINQLNVQILFQMKKVANNNKLKTKGSKKVLNSPSKTLLKRESSIKQLKLQNLEKPKTLMIVYYKQKRLSIPVFQKCQNSVNFIRKNLIKFEQEILGNKKGQKIKNIISFRTKEKDVLKDYYIFIGKDVSIFKVVEIEPMWKTIQLTGLANYQIYKCIGQGGFSKVYLARKISNGNFYALKVINKKIALEDNRIEMIRTQDQILKILDHPFLVKMGHSFETKNYIVFVLEYCPGGQLFYHLRKLKRLTENQAKIYFIQMLLAFQYLHQQKILYRDIKPENIMMDSQGHLKLSDFGLSKVGLDRNQKTFSFCGSNEYMAPEMVLQEGHTYELDYYCLGALLYQFVIGYPPFYCHDKDKIFERVKKQQVTFPENLNLSQQIKWILKDLLKKNPKQRLGSLGGVREILAHPFLKKCNIKSILKKQIQPPIKPNILLYNLDEQDIQINEQQIENLKQEKQIQSEILTKQFKIQKNGDSQQYIMKPINKPVNKKSKSNNNKQQSHNKRQQSNKKRQSSNKTVKKSNSKSKLNTSFFKKRKDTSQINITKKSNLTRIKSAQNLQKCNSKKNIRFK